MDKTPPITITDGLEGLENASSLRGEEDQQELPVDDSILGQVQSLSPRFLDPEEVTYDGSIRLGSGTTGVVYRGRYRGHGVACKVFHDDSQEARELLNQEVSIWREFRHPCIVTCFGGVKSPGSPIMVNELCAYGSLSSAMMTFPAKWTTKMKVKALHNCACAMSFLHHSSVVYRDLKPDNLLVTSLDSFSSVVCKLDCSPCARRTSEGKRLTLGVGTPIFMAPEMMSSTSYTNKADVYSFGVTIAAVWNRCDLESLYPEISSLLQLCEAVTKGVRPKVVKVEEMPPQLKTLMENCWDENPDNRPCFDLIVERLERLLETL